ncbi:MAG: NAD-dependent epimerase/dehydratase family protein [Acidimicrobiales bacterium]|jgi:UDP-glucose 4-epimerase
MMRIWVTGGAGFLGSHICDRLLAEGHQVDALDDLSSGDLANLAEARRHDDFSFHQIDVRRPELIELARRHRPDAVIHAVGFLERPGSIHAPREDTEVNLGALLRVLATARAVECRRVVAVVHATPEADTAPATPAEVNAWTAIDHLRIHHEQAWIETAAAVVANVYGPRQMVDDQGPLVARMARQVTRGEPCVIHGDGLQTRDLVFVDDAVSAVVSCLEAPSGSVVPIGSGSTSTPLDVLGLIETALGRSVDVLHEPARVPDPDRPAWPIDTAHALLGWAPWTDLEDGVGEVLAEWRTRVVEAPAADDVAPPV